jgi:transcriptional regulator with XRE-family HTH domain
MSTSRTTVLSKPEGSNKISLGTLGYIRARNRQRAYNLVIREFKKSGLTQADLARRLGKAAEVVSRLLSRPRNWELDTFSDLLFAISGAVPRFDTDYPLIARKDHSSVDEVVRFPQSNADVNKEHIE